MQRRRLANTNMQVSALGFGTVKFGRNQGVKYPQGFELPSDQQARELLALAKDLGINLLDTAPAYGSSEERLGSLLAGQRQDWIICTKVGEEFINGQSYFNFTPGYVRESVVRSLQRLNTDYLDVVLVHSSGEDVDIIQRYGVLEVLNDLKSEGLIRATGMSTKTVEGGLLAASQSDVVMATRHPGYEAEREVFDYCHDHQKAVFVKKAFASGHLQQLGDNPVEQALRFAFEHPASTAVIVGTLNPEHLRQNAAVAEAVLNSSP